MLPAREANLNCGGKQDNIATRYSVSNFGYFFLLPACYCFLFLKSGFLRARFLVDCSLAKIVSWLGFSV